MINNNKNRDQSLNYSTITTQAVRLFGLSDNKTTHREKGLAAVGTAISMLTLYLTLKAYSGDQAIILLIASIAASAVLVFTVPQGTYSQPWPILGSYLLSALIGVTCQKWFLNLAIAIPISVAGSMLAMSYCRCLHPPGGAVALTAVAGGPEISQLGYQFVLFPVTLNAGVLLLTSFCFNKLFRNSSNHRQ